MARSRSPSRSLARQTWPVGPFAGGSRRGRPAQGRAAGRGAAFAEPAVARASTAAPAPAAAVVGLVRLRPPQPVSSAHSPCRYPPFSRPFLRRFSAAPPPFLTGFLARVRSQGLVVGGSGSQRVLAGSGPAAAAAALMAGLRDGEGNGDGDGDGGAGGGQRLRLLRRLLLR